MDSKLLIDAIVKQTTVLIASLSTASGIRAPLAHVADQVFLDLAREIESQGVGRKVVADMFGLALRTYQRKVQRLSESVSERNRSLWEAVFAFINENEQLDRKQIEERFDKDLPEDVAAVLNDLVTNGLVFCTGLGKNAVYRAVYTSKAPDKVDCRDIEALANLVWANVYRRQATTIEALSQTLGVSRDDIKHAVCRLVQDGRIKSKRADHKDANKNGGEPAEPGEPGELADLSTLSPLSPLSASTLLVPVGAKQGWEAAVFDHFSTVAAAIASKVNQGPGSQADDVIGGATLCFEVHADHPLQDKVYGLLRRIRAEVNELWNQVENHNRINPVPEEDKVKVYFYFGQNVASEDQSVSGKERKPS